MEVKYGNMRKKREMIYEIKKDDDTCYSYTKLAQGCTGKKEAKEYERLFKSSIKTFKHP